MGKIKNIVFDLGGVVIGINEPATVKRFKEAGISNIEELIDPYRQKRLIQSI
jgi:putative hydrolase of the HAD superfamily